MGESVPAHGRPRRIAVVGSGVAGLTAAWVLQCGRGPSTDVTLYEADDRPGGHAHTHRLTRADGSGVDVDSGFIVHNRVTYPTLLRLFDELDIATQPAEMSMSVHCDGCGLEYAGAKGPSGLFPTAGTLRRPRYLAMLAEVMRFHRRARQLVAGEITARGVPAAASVPDVAPAQLHTSEPAAGDPTLREFLAAGNFSTYFQQHFMTPVVSAVWSTAPGKALDYPARYLFRFLLNHGMLSVSGSHAWRTVVGGSATYVGRITDKLASVRLGAPVRSVRDTGDGVAVRAADDREEHYDAVVLAGHPDQALAVLAEPTAVQSEVLGAITYSDNATVLHSDDSVLPSAERAQASWNYRMGRCTDDAASVRVSYDMNRLQSLPGPDRYVVTLGDAERIDPARVISAMTYAHPLYTPASVAAQQRLPECDSDRIAFAGAYHGWGFHEDGCAAGLAAARRVGGSW